MGAAVYLAFARDCRLLQPDFVDNGWLYLLHINIILLFVLLVGTWLGLPLLFSCELSMDSVASRGFEVAAVRLSSHGLAQVAMYYTLSHALDLPLLGACKLCFWRFLH